MKRIESFDSNVYLVNTGWIGGGYGTGKRIGIPETRMIIHAIQSGALENVETEYLAGLNLDIPKKVPGIDSTILNPSQTWDDLDNYNSSAKALITKFLANFEKFDVDESILQAGPHL